MPYFIVYGADFDFILKKSAPFHPFLREMVHVDADSPPCLSASDLQAAN